MPPETIPALVQFGAAGLIAFMWLTERRAAAAREKQLAELHDRLIRDRTHIRTLLSVVADNTRALTALELGQRHLATLLQRLAARPSPSGRMTQCAGTNDANEPRA